MSLCYKSRQRIIISGILAFYVLVKNSNGQIMQNSFASKFGIQIKGTSFKTHDTGSNIQCSSYCLLENSCLAFQTINDECRLFDQSNDLFEVDFTRSGEGFFNLQKVTLPDIPEPTTTIAPTTVTTTLPPESPLPGTVSSFSGRYGTFTDLKECEDGSAVSQIKAWKDSYSGSTVIIDDVGLSEIEMTCSTKTGQLTNLMKLGLEWSGSVMYEFQCPAGYFIWRLRTAYQAKYAGYVYDEVETMGLEVECNDISVTKYMVAYPTQYIKDEGSESVLWTDWQVCLTGYSICGFAVKVEGPSSDTTAINEVKLQCCWL